MSPPALRPEPPQLAWRAFEALSARDLHDMLRLRADVFVVEQACAFAEIDGRDPEALHLLARIPGSDGLAGTLRLFAPAADAPASIGRVATAAWARGLGLGRALVREGLAEARRRFGGTPVEIGAQSRLEAFYASLGFVRTSPDYDEDGILHCTMVRDADSQRSHAVADMRHLE